MMSPPAKLGSVCLATLLVLSGCNYPLLNAASDGDTPKVLVLLDQGVDANASLPVIGTPPLTLAAAGGHVETVCVLLDRGAQVTATDITGWTALHAAAYKGHSKIVRLLVERGAPTAPTNWVLPEPLVWAEKGGHTEVVAVQGVQLHAREVPQPEVERYLRVAEVVGQAAGELQVGFLQHVRRIDAPVEPAVEPELHQAAQPVAVPGE